MSVHTYLKVRICDDCFLKLQIAGFDCTVLSAEQFRSKCVRCGNQGRLRLFGLAVSA